MWILQQLVEEMKKTPVPDGVVYEPVDHMLWRHCRWQKRLETISYGELPDTDRLLQWT